MKQVECLVCGYVGKPKKITPRYMGHWRKGLFLCKEICPHCGDTAIELAKRRGKDWLKWRNKKILGKEQVDEL